jgi:hypothetical protein
MRRLFAAFLLCFTSSLVATEYVFENFDILLRDRLGSTWNSQLDVKLGVFAADFVPTLQNYDSWQANFITEQSPGYYLGPNAGGPEYSAALRLADNSVLAVGMQIRLWIHTPAGFPGQIQTALFTDANWLVVSNSPTDVVTRYYDFSNVTSADFGTFDFNNNLAATVAVPAVPEPSTYGFTLGAMAFFCALMRRRFRDRRK